MSLIVSTSLTPFRPSHTHRLDGNRLGTSPYHVRADARVHVSAPAGASAPLAEEQAQVLVSLIGAHDKRIPVRCQCQ